MGRDPSKKRAAEKEDAPEPEAEEEEEAGGEEEEEEEEEEWEDEEFEEAGEPVEGGQEVWRAGVDPLGEGEELEFDPSAYDCLHAFQLEWPCLSFDLLRDELGECRRQWPHSAYLVAGSQSDTAGNNTLTVARLTHLVRTWKAAESDSDSESESDSEGARRQGPELQTRQLAHHGAVNRVHAQPQAPHIVATWAETGHVQVWDVRPQLSALHGEAGARGSAKLARVPPRQVFTGHTTEGFALAWSPVAAGALLSGDCAGAIHSWAPTEGGRWLVAPEPYSGHSGASVEDVQWSPNEGAVFASVGCDGGLAIWDARRRGSPALRVLAHDCDVNVLSWNALAPAMVATGGDEGALRVWDLRRLADATPVAHFKHHRGAITSVEWAPFDSSTLATASADHSAAVWDLAVERDAEEEAAAFAATGNALPPAELPPQLMFVHQGQRDLKELHWHGQVPGLVVTTSATGFNVWKPSNQGNPDEAPGGEDLVMG